METKLTLTLNRTVVSSAKRYARNNRKSLSAIVEDYFKGLKGDDTQTFQYPALIKELSGVISERDLKKISKDDERVRYILGER